MLCRQHPSGAAVPSSQNGLPLSPFMPWMLGYCYSSPPPSKKTSRVRGIFIFLVSDTNCTSYVPRLSQPPSFQLGSLILVWTSQVGTKKRGTLWTFSLSFQEWPGAEGATGPANPAKTESGNCDLLWKLGHNALINLLICFRCLISQFIKIELAVFYNVASWSS